MQKKIIISAIVLITAFFVYKFFVPNAMKYNYVIHEEMLKCSAENYKMGSVDYQGQVDGYSYKHWKIKLDNLANGKHIEANLLSVNEDPITKGTSVMLASNCQKTSLDQYSEDYKKAVTIKPEDETLKNDYDVYFYDEDNKQVEMKSAKIIGKNIYLNMKDYIQNDDKTKQQ